MKGIELHLEANDEFGKPISPFCLELTLGYEVPKPAGESATRRTLLASCPSPIRFLIDVARLVPFEPCCFEHVVQSGR
jgi:hypothetical protein